MDHCSHLPPGWSEHQSRSHPGLLYFYNRLTGNSTWARPGLESKKTSLTLASHAVPDSLPTRTSPAEIAWSFGCMIGSIFNKDPNDLNLSCLKNIPEKLQAIYKKCLSKNPLKRPSIKILQELLSSCAEFHTFLSIRTADDKNHSDDRHGEMKDEGEASRHGAVINEAWKWMLLVNKKETLKHACSLCSKRYVRRQHLRRHTLSDHSCALEDLLPKKLFNCQIFNKSYGRPQYLKRHMQQHLPSSSGQRFVQKSGSSQQPTNSSKKVHP